MTYSCDLPLPTPSLSLSFKIYLSECCGGNGSIILTASGRLRGKFGYHLGTLEPSRNNEIHNGRPIYRNYDYSRGSADQMYYQNGGWMASINLYFPTVRSKSSTVCPTDATDWEAFDFDRNLEEICQQRQYPNLWDYENWKQWKPVDMTWEPVEITVQCSSPVEKTTLGATTEATTHGATTLRTTTHGAFTTEAASCRCGVERDGGSTSRIFGGTEITPVSIKKEMK